MNHKKLRSSVCLVASCAVLGTAIGLGAAFLVDRNSGDDIPMQELAEAQRPTVPVETGIPMENLTAAEPVERDWRLTLVNPWNEIDEDYEVTLAKVENGQSVDERCYFDLLKMLEDCREEGLDPVVVSSYRTQEKQQSLFDNKVMRVMAQGYSEEEAPAVAAREVAMPGTSEHQLGLAVDLVHNGNWNLDESQEDTPTQQWLMENSWRYGFILRYPNDKSGITGIIYEPWHYRYVGREHASKIYERGICLEEYLENMNG